MPKQWTMALKNKQIELLARISTIFLIDGTGDYLVDGSGNYLIST